MALQFVVDLAAFDGLSDDLKKLYKKREDGKFQLDAEGVADKAKLDEFRNNNREMSTANADLLEKLKSFEGIDPAKYKTFMDKFQSDEEKKLLKDGNLEEVIKLRIAGIVKDFEEKMSAKEKIIVKLQDETKKATGDKDTYIVENELRKAVDNNDLGFHENVANIIKDSVLKEFIHKDGKVVRVKPDGSAVYGASGEPQGLDEYVRGYAKDHPYLVKSSSGGGAHHDTTNGKGHTNGQKTMPRAEFDKLTPEARNKFILVEKGVPVDA